GRGAPAGRSRSLGGGGGAVVGPQGPADRCGRALPAGRQWVDRRLSRAVLRSGDGPRPDLSARRPGALARRHGALPWLAFGGRVPAPRLDPHDRADPLDGADRLAPGRVGGTVLSLLSQAGKVAGPP